MIVLCLSAWFFSCGRNAVVTDDYAERQVDSTVFSIHDIDSLSTVMESYASGGNTYGEMVAARNSEMSADSMMRSMSTRKVLSRPKSSEILYR